MSTPPHGSTTPDKPEPDQSSSSHHLNYRLRVTAGTSYDISTHKLVPVNAPETLTFETSSIIISLAVRLRKFTGLPSSSPQTSPYFDHPLHKSDQYSISFSFIPKTSIPGTDLVFGNDFDRPIRDRLPPGFNQAFRIVKWMIDPGLDGDVYADKPYLYGAALSSWNFLRICDKIIEDPNSASDNSWQMPNATSFHETPVLEGAEGTGSDIRTELSIPADAGPRKKHFLTASNLQTFTFEAGRLYQADFGNPYLDFNDFSLKLPGFSLNVIKYVDSKTHELRYTLKNKTTGDVYAVVLFTLLFGEELVQAEKEEEEHGSEKHEPTTSATGSQQTTANGVKDTKDQSSEHNDIPDTAAADDDVD